MVLCSLMYLFVASCSKHVILVLSKCYHSVIIVDSDIAVTLQCYTVWRDYAPHVRVIGTVGFLGSLRLHHVTLRNATLCHVTFCCTVLCCALLCSALLCYVTLCYVTLCYLMLCCGPGSP
jgi:hypothetical protein